MLSLFFSLKGDIMGYFSYEDYQNQLKYDGSEGVDLEKEMVCRKANKMDRFMRVYMPIFMLFLWATLTINHYLRDLNWMPLMWLFIPLFAMVYFSIKEQIRIDEES